jgi:epsilon-lactone hydrolase
MKGSSMSEMEQAAERPTVTVEGVITVPRFDLPLSAALSPQAAEAQARALSFTGGISLTDLDVLETEAEYRAAVDAFRAGLDQMFAKPLAEKILSGFPVDIRPRQIGGVPVEEFTPLGEQDPGRVLINLHGGAFYSGATYIARVESIPLAHLGRFRVVSVDYRQGYEHRYPAASEDVAAVYAELLKSYSAERIGIYGGSAGGALSLQATAWMLDHGLPAPGALGVFGSGAGGRGDGDYFAAIGTGQVPRKGAFAFRAGKHGYFGGVDFENRQLNPIVGGKDFCAKFPPSLFVTGTRAFDLSPAIATHRALCQAGVDAELHVFDGMGHCFYYDTDLPESRDAYGSIVRFFQKHLSR